jgi:MscS family membrane protein
MHWIVPLPAISPWGPGLRRRKLPAICSGTAICALVLLCWLPGLGGAARAADSHPLQPVASGSPRETLLGFLAETDAIYRLIASIIDGYATSGHLYLSAEGHAKQAEVPPIERRAIRALDMSGIPPVLQSTVPVERMLMLRAILDRIDLPAAADIPDRATMVQRGLKKWRLPDTEIDLVLIESGERAGEYLVSAATVDRLPEFFARVKDLPVKSDVTLAVRAAIQKLNPGYSAPIYEAYLSSPAGLGYIVPPRWILELPSWAKARVFGLTSWQWLGLAIGLAIGALLILAAHRLARRIANRRGEARAPRWDALPIPVAFIFVGSTFLPLVLALFRISGEVRVLLEYALSAAVYLAAAWLSMVVAILVGDVIVTSERLQTGNLDSQLIQLGTRFVGLVAAIATLIHGADRLGLPAYSVLAGLGVGGLAVALAARDSVANLFGSILIMFEKPFRVGHLIRIDGTLGTVEEVGFRSTRIRTLDNSLVSIPNNSVVNTKVENLTLRPMRRQHFLVQVTYDTTPGKMEALLEGIRKIVTDHPFTDSTNFHIRFNDFGESSLNILLIFHVITNEFGLELRYREEVLLQIMKLMNEMGINFAFPTRTLHVETTTQAAFQPT